VSGGRPVLGVYTRWMQRARMLMLVVAVVSCSGQSEQARPTEAVDLVGDWRSVLDSPGGELPFALRITERSGTLVASIVNDTEELPWRAERGFSARFRPTEIEDRITTLLAEFIPN